MRAARRDGEAAQMRQLLYLSHGDVLGLDLPMADMVDVVEAAFRARGQGRTVMPPKLSLHGPGDAFSQVMAASIQTAPAERDAGTTPGVRRATGDAGGLGTKWVCLFPSNLALGLPTLHGLLVLSAPSTGVPLAVIDAAAVTALRTGAGVGLAARLLARGGATVVGLLGCGVQGASSLRALAAVLPDLRSTRLFDTRPEAAERLAASLSAELPGVEFLGCREAGQVPEGAQVVVTAITMTEGVEPPLGVGLLEPGAIVVALDYDAAWSPRAMAECDRFVVDDTAQVLATKAAGGRLGGIPARIDADLSEIAAGLQAGRERDDERIFCMNLGVAIEDVSVGMLVYRRALEAGVGTRLPL